MTGNSQSNWRRRTLEKQKNFREAEGITQRVRTTK